MDLPSTKIIGITGGIGAGKSVIARIFKEMGIIVFDCDSVAKSLYNSDDTLRKFIVENYGQSLYNTPSGKLDRALLAKILFSDSQALHKVEEQVHSRTIESFKQWVATQHTEWCGLESAILYKVKPLMEMCNAVVEVDAPEALRIKRVRVRDDAPIESIKKRIAAQNITIPTNLTQPLFRIVNDDAYPLLPQVREVFQKLSQL